jgi:hypothetical protein
MDLHPLIRVGLLIALISGPSLIFAWLRRRGLIDPSRDRVRRGVGHAMLGMKEFLEPSVEYVYQAENVEQAEEDDHDASGDGPAAILDDLAASLGRDPIDPEEVRRHLAAARRVGLDWRGAFDQAVRDELAARPYRAPSIPPVWRVAPRDS